MFTSDMIKILSYFTGCIFIVGCSSLPPEPWDDVYFKKSNFDGHIDINCSNKDAKSIASRAVKFQYPEHYEAFMRSGFSLYSPIYGDYRGQLVKRYTFKSILGYKEIEHLAQSGSYYEKSIEVSLSKECAVLGVDYFKGKIEYIY